MKLRPFIAGALAGCALAAPAAAEEPAPHRAGVEPPALFRGLIREGDVALLFDHLREALAAAAEGREPPSTAGLDARAAELGRELKLRGFLAGLALLHALEARARESLGEPAPRLPPPAPSAIPARQEL